MQAGGQCGLPIITRIQHPALAEVEACLLEKSEAAPDASARQKFLKNLINEFIWFCGEPSGSAGGEVKFHSTWDMPEVGDSTNWRLRLKSWAGFPACRLAGHSCPGFAPATGKSSELADKNVCLTGCGCLEPSPCKWMLEGHAALNHSASLLKPLALPEGAARIKSGTSRFRSGKAFLTAHSSG